MAKKIIIVLFQEKVDGWYHHARYFSEADKMLCTYKVKGTKPLNFKLKLNLRRHHLLLQSEYSLRKRGEVKPIDQWFLKLVKKISVRRYFKLKKKIKILDIKEKNIFLIDIDSDSPIDKEIFRDIEYFEIFFPRNMKLNKALDIIYWRLK